MKVFFGMGGNIIVCGDFLTWHLAPDFVVDTTLKIIFHFKVVNSKFYNFFMSHLIAKIYSFNTFRLNLPKNLLIILTPCNLLNFVIFSTFICFFLTLCNLYPSMISSGSHVLQLLTYSDCCRLSVFHSGRSDSVSFSFAEKQ